ncbi:uncharacterized protein [Magallana gigas]|uniref:uncharacterized protein isoform X2 n=1 Tax=Magallana gigas TaxID=29159 RepID=UPI00333F447E
MEKNYLSTAVIFSFLMVRASGFCGVHQTLDVVILYDVSSSMSSTDIADQVSFIHNLAGNIYLHSDHTNIAGIGVGNTAHYGWGLRDYLTTDDLMARMQNITVTSEASDISPGFDMAWNNILSNSTRPGSTRWVLVFTDTSFMSSTTSLDAIKAAGIKVGFISVLSATSYTSYASDSRYILGGINWATLDSDLPTVISMICPPYCESFDFYYELPNSMAVIADTNSNVGYYLISESKGPSAYNIHCCGALSSVEFKAATSGSFVLQVWRAEYLIYQTTITATGGYETHVFSPKVAIAMSDIIGWYSAGVNPIGMATSCVGDLCPQDIKIVTDMGSLSVGDFYDWSSASTMPDTAFAIKFTIVNGLISLMTSLPVTGVETPYFLTMSVMDSCFNTASIAINITTFVQPLAINNLPTEVEIGDDVSFETLLIVINATDPAADSISCILSSILPNTTNFRLDDYLNGTAGMFLNAGAALDFKTVEEYKISITCTGMSSTESFMTVRILDKSVTTPYTVPAWAAGAIVVSVGSVGVVLAMVCFLIVVILATTDEAEVMPPMEEDENDKTPLDDVAQMCKIIDRWESEQEGVGEI